MSFANCFWILMLVWLVFGCLTSPRNWQGFGGNLLLFILLLLLGWRVFGQPIHS